MDVLSSCAHGHGPQGFMAMEARPPRSTPITVDPRLELGIHYWNMCVQYQLLVVAQPGQIPDIKFNDNPDPSWTPENGWDGASYYGLTWLSQRAIDGRWEGMYVHELGHSVFDLGHKPDANNQPGDPRISGGIMGGDELRNPDHDRAMVGNLGYHLAPLPAGVTSLNVPPPAPPAPPPVLDHRAQREQEREERRVAREQRRAERRARRGR